MADKLDKRIDTLSREKPIKKANHTLTTAFLLTFLNSVLVMALGLAFLPTLIRLLGAKENTTLFTEQYVRVILLGSFFTMGSYTIGALLRSEGSPQADVYAALRRNGIHVPNGIPGDGKAGLCFYHHADPAGCSVYSSAPAAESSV